MTESHLGSPEREMEVTSQPRATANLQMREPRKPLPPQTTSFLAAALDMMCGGTLGWLGDEWVCQWRDVAFVAIASEVVFVAESVRSLKLMMVLQLRLGEVERGYIEVGVVDRSFKMEDIVLWLELRASLG